MGAPPSSLETWSSLSLSLGHLGQEEADTSTALMMGFSAARFQGVEAVLPCWAPFGLRARVNGSSVCWGTAGQGHHSGFSGLLTGCPEKSEETTVMGCSLASLGSRGTSQG